MYENIYALDMCKQNSSPSHGNFDRKRKKKMNFMKRIEYKRIMAMRYEYNQVHTTIENAITNGMSCVFNGRSGFSQPLFKL